MASECHFGRGHTEMLRRLHKLRNEQEQDFRIVQIGAMDGKSNDPIFLSMFKPHVATATTSNYWPPYPVGRVKATLVEPVHMKQLRKQYSTWTQSIPELTLRHFQFVEKAITEVKAINEEGKCVFYTPSVKCPMKMKWLQQISGLDPSHMRKHFQNESALCIQEHSLPCVTVSGLLRSTGQDLVPQPAPAPAPASASAAVLGGQEGQEVWCHHNDSIPAGQQTTVS